MRFSKLRTLLKPMIEEMIPWFEKKVDGNGYACQPIKFPSRGFPGTDYISNENNVAKRSAALANFLQQLLDRTYEKAIASPAFHEGLGLDNRARAALLALAGARKATKDRKQLQAGVGAACMIGAGVVLGGLGALVGSGDGHCGRGHRHRCHGHRLR